jgi:hypothetical protein
MGSTKVSHRKFIFSKASKVLFPNLFGDGPIKIIHCKTKKKKLGKHRPSN